MLTIDRNSPVPIYMQIEQMFEEMIFEQRLEANDALPSAPTLGDELGVSTLTVQKAYRHLQERGLVYSIAGKGTFAARLKDRPFVAIIIQNQVLLERSHGEALPLLMQGVHGSLVQQKLSPRLLIDTNPRQMRAGPMSDVVMDVLRRGRVEGIVTIGHYGSDEFFEMCRERSIPTVSWGIIDPRFNAQAEPSSTEMLSRSLRHMKNAGIDDVGLMWLNRPNNTPAAQAASVRDFQEAFAAEGMPAKLDSIVGVPEPSEWAGYHAFMHLWKLPGRPRGLIMLDEVFGRGVMMAMQSQGIQSPRDMRMVVASYEDTKVVFPETWSRCEISLKECGCLVASLMRDLVNGNGAPPVTYYEFKWHEAVESAEPEDGRRTIFNIVPVPQIRNGKKILEVAGMDVPSGEPHVGQAGFVRAFAKESVR